MQHAKHPQLAKHHYEKIRIVGRGTFGTVWLVRHHATGKQFIRKEVSMANMPRHEQKATMQEVEVLKRLQHPHIVAYVDSYRDGDNLCILMEYANDGDLASRIAAKKRAGAHFSETEVLTILHQAASALACCHHTHKLLHRDLKPANIFLDDGEVKLGDFGVSKFLAFSQAKAMTQCGTPLYMSPEMCQGQPYTRAADVWALGCVLYELMTMRAPWVAQLNPQAARGGMHGLMRQISGGRIDTSGVRGRYSSGLCALLHALLAKNPAERPSMNALLRWPVLRAVAPLPDEGLEPCAAAATPESPDAPDAAAGADAHAAAAAISHAFQRSFGRRRPGAAAAVRPAPAAVQPSVLRRVPSAIKEQPSPAAAPATRRAAWAPAVPHPAPAARPLPSARPPVFKQREVAAAQHILRSFRRSRGNKQQPLYPPSAVQRPAGAPARAYPGGYGISDAAAAARERVAALRADDAAAARARVEAGMARVRDAEAAAAAARARDAEAVRAAHAARIAAAQAKYQQAKAKAAAAAAHAQEMQRLRYAEARAAAERRAASKLQATFRSSLERRRAAGAGQGGGGGGYGGYVRPLRPSAPPPAHARPSVFRAAAPKPLQPVAPPAAAARVRQAWAPPAVDDEKKAAAANVLQRSLRRSLNRRAPRRANVPAKPPLPVFKPPVRAAERPAPAAAAAAKKPPPPVFVPRVQPQGFAADRLARLAQPRHVIARHPAAAGHIAPPRHLARCR